MKPSYTRYPAILLSAALVAAACTDSGGSDEATATTAKPTTTTEAPTTTAAMVDDDHGDDMADHGGLVAEVSTDQYLTIDQMLLANEINESGEPFAESLGYDLDELDPEVAGSPDDTAYVLGIENYEYSRYQLGTVVRNSGIGLHMMWAPLVRKAAANEDDDFDGSFTGEANGTNEDDELVKTIMAFSALSNEPPPGNAWPQFAEFVSGDPHLPAAPDPETFDWTDVSTMRWDRSTFDQRLNPGAMGQTLMKQYLWAQDMLSAFHDGDNEGIDADGTISPDQADSPLFDPDNNVFYGGDSRDGFIGLVLTAEGINKIAFMTGALAYDGSELGAIDLASYDPANGIQYFPHMIAVTEGEIAPDLPPGVTALSVDDASSVLFDQASLLWGTVSFTNMMNPSDSSDSAHLAYKEVFDGAPFPASASETGTPGPYDLMKGTSKAIFQNLMAMHFDADAKVFVDEATLDGASVVRGETVSVQDSAYLLVALEGFVEQFEGTPLQDAALAAAANQANFMMSNLSDGSGHYFASTTVEGSAGEAGTVEAQAAAIRGLYVAARITGEQAFTDAADEAYQVLLDDFYVDADHIFRTEAGSDIAVYTPRNFALLAGALREATLEGNQSDAASIYVSLSQIVGNQMQVAESGTTGESGGDSDGDGIPFTPEQPDHLPEIFASEAIFTLSS